MWTIATVKAELPQVTVKANGVTYAARVSGRLNKFATVSLIQPVDVNRNRRGCLVSPAGPMFADYQYSWDAIAEALNKGHALTV